MEKKVSRNRRRSGSNMYSWSITLLCWVGLGSLIYFVDPDVLKPVYLTPFWALLFIAMSWTIGLLFKRASRGVIYSSSILLFLLLRYIGMGYVVIAVFLLGLAITIDWYLGKTT